MKPKVIINVACNIMMTIFLILLMSYSLIGESTHEILGISIFVLFILHHILNYRFEKNIFHGKYTAYRTFQTIVVIVIFITMTGSMISSIALSKYMQTFISIPRNIEFMRITHLLSAYWGFVMMSIHLGIHWKMSLSLIYKIIRHNHTIKICFKIIGFLIAFYGVYALIKRNLLSYLFLQTMFVFIDFGEPVIYFLLDYSAMVGLFIFIGYNLTSLLKNNRTSIK